MNLRPLTLDDAPAWADLLALSFDRTPDDMQKLLRWLHAGYEMVAWGAWDGERLAAQYACLLVNLHLPDNETNVQAGMSLNMSVHPDYRGRGLIKQVSKPVYETVAAQGGLAGMGFSNAEGVKVDRNSKGYGYQVVGQMIPALAWLPPNRKTPALDLNDHWSESALHLPPQNGHITFSASLESIRHRYAQHPFRQYHYGIWPERGVVVYRPIKFGVALLAAYGVDLPELLARWSSALRKTGFQFVHVLTSPQSELRKALSQVAVCRSLPYARTPYYLTVKPFEQHTPESMLDFSAWDLMGGDIL